MVCIVCFDLWLGVLLIQDTVPESIVHASVVRLQAAKYRGLHNVCNRNVKFEKATAFLIWMIPFFSDCYLTTISSASLLQTFCNPLRGFRVHHTKPGTLSCSVYCLACTN